MFRKIASFFSDKDHGLARSVRPAIAALAIGGFTWAQNFTEQPRIAIAIKAATVIALLYVAAHDGKTSDQAGGQP
jgi:hypothetical protein